METDPELPGRILFMEMNTTRIYQDDRGNWHWIYRLPMFKNFSILRTIMKPIGVCCILPTVLAVILILKNGRSFSDEKEILMLTIGLGVLVLAITVLCYFLVAALFGGNYIFIYTMTDHSLTVNQPAGQAARSMAIGAFTSAAGAVGGNPGVMMAGLAARGNQITSSEFDKILSLKIDPPAGEIRIHSFLTWYSIYVGPDDFAFVAEYLRTRCKNAAISE